MNAAQKTEQQDALTRLRSQIKPGATVYTQLLHVSRSGMSRIIQTFLIQDNQPHRIGALVARALGAPYNCSHDGIRVTGCGMDMGFSIVYELASALFPDGFDCTGNNAPDYCPSADHANGDRDYTPHRHKSGGYALVHRWL